jgi:AbrB family looped-hinge helix DNA binding protein
MTHLAKVISGGKIVIPAQLRRTIGVRDGDTVVVEHADGALIIRTREEAIRRLQDEVRRRTPETASLVDELIAERRREAARDEEGA